MLKLEELEELRRALQKPSILSSESDERLAELARAPSLNWPHHKADLLAEVEMRIAVRKVNAGLIR